MKENENLNQLKKELQELKETNKQLKKQREEIESEYQKHLFPFKYDAVIQKAREEIQKALENIETWDLEISENWEKAYLKWIKLIPDDYFYLAFSDLFMFIQEFLKLEYNKEFELKLVAYAMVKGKLFFQAMQ